MSEINEDIEKLELPNMFWGNLLVYFGPGIILMMTGVGTSHLVTAPTAGGQVCLCIALVPSRSLYI